MKQGMIIKSFMTLRKRTSRFNLLMLYLEYILFKFKLIGRKIDQ